jgi:hypothetical protein
MSIFVQLASWLNMLEPTVQDRQMPGCLIHFNCNSSLVEKSCSVRVMVCISHQFVVSVYWPLGIAMPIGVMSICQCTISFVECFNSESTLYSV